MMISVLISYLYYLTPLWLLFIIFFRLNKQIILALPSVMFFLIVLALLVEREKIAQSLAITAFFLLLISFVYIKLNEKN